MLGGAQANTCVGGTMDGKTINLIRANRRDIERGGERESESERARARARERESGERKNLPGALWYALACCRTFFHAECALERTWQPLAAWPPLPGSSFHSESCSALAHAVFRVVLVLSMVAAPPLCFCDFACCLLCRFILKAHLLIFISNLPGVTASCTMTVLCAQKPGAKVIE